MTDARKLHIDSAQTCEEDLSSASIAADKESACPLCNSSFSTAPEQHRGRSSLLNQISIELVDSHPKTILDRLVDFLAECISDLEHHVSSKLADQQSEEELEEELARLARAKKLQTEAIDLQRALLEKPTAKRSQDGPITDFAEHDEIPGDSIQIELIQDIHSRALQLHEVCEVLVDRHEEKGVESPTPQSNTKLISSKCS